MKQKFSLKQPTIGFFLLLISMSSFGQQTGKPEESNDAQMVRIHHIKFIHYYNLSDSLAERHKWKPACAFLDSALNHCVTQSKDSLIEKRASYLFKLKDYTNAAEDYSVLILKGVNTKENLYSRAVCYKKTHKIQEAVNDLKAAMKLGNLEAEKLHEQINPEKKRVAYYVTRCCDGSTSNATGSGACSHHGGVCNWKDPVYETYREYQ